MFPCSNLLFSTEVICCNDSAFSSMQDYIKFKNACFLFLFLPFPLFPYYSLYLKSTDIFISTCFRGFAFSSVFGR